MILFIARNPPNPAGPGGCQRAMNLLQAVRRHGPVDLILLYRAEDRDSVEDTLAAAHPLVRTCASMEVTEWAPSWQRWPRLPSRIGQVVEQTLIHTVDAPRFSRKTLRSIATLLPSKHYDVVFAARLSSAVIAQSLIAAGHLTADFMVADLDDRLSTLKQQFLVAEGAKEGRLRRHLQRIDVRRLHQAELKVGRAFDAIALASRIDADALSAELSKPAYTAPNIIDRPLLPAAPATATPRILFVGHLGYRPNVQGLSWFVEEVWPLVRRKLPNAALNVVGKFPDARVEALVETAGATLHADVPSVEPFYTACDAVIAPILVGSGTRIKILEAMAYGRPVVSTSLGAEGLDVVSGQHLLLADVAEDFANAIVEVASNQTLRRSLVENARLFQQTYYGPTMLDETMARIMPSKPIL